MNVRSLFSMTAPCREDFEIPCHAVGDPRGSLRLAAVGGIHGNELNGVFVLARLADFLRRAGEGLLPGVRMAGRAMIIPAVNVLGLNNRMRLWPFDKTDINRMFPGYDGGETTQRIAAAVLKATQSAPLRVDIHSSNLDIEEYPHLRLYEPTAAEKKGAENFGLPIVEKLFDKMLSVSLIRAWKDLPGENYVLRGGQAGELQLPHCEKIFQSLVSFLFSVGILSGENPPALEDDRHYFEPGRSFKLISEEAGFFVSKQEVGRWIQVGDLIGVLFDAFQGKVRTEIHAPVSGLLLGLRRQPLVFEGDLIARIQTRPAPSL